MMKAGPARRLAPGGAVPEAVLDRGDAGRSSGWSADGTIVIASGGGGIPVIEKGPRLIGKEGVVDKDLAAAILAHEVGGVGAADPHRREDACSAGSARSTRRTSIA